MRKTKLFLSCLLVMALAGCGDPETELARSFGESADALILKLGAPGEKTEVPLPSDPDAKRFEEQAGKALKALGSDELPIRGLETYEPLCVKAANVGGAYAMAGAAIAEKAGAPGAVGALDMAKRAEELFGQMLTPVLFSAHCGALHLPAAEEAANNSSESNIAGIDQMRSGTAQQVQGLIEMASGEDLELATRARIVNVLAEDASKYAIALTPQRRQELTGAVRQLKLTLPPELAGKADKIESDIKQAPCGKLCSA